MNSNNFLLPNILCLDLILNSKMFLTKSFNKSSIFIVESTSSVMHSNCCRLSVSPFLRHQYQVTLVFVWRSGWESTDKITRLTDFILICIGLEYICIAKSWCFVKFSLVGHVFATSFVVLRNISLIPVLSAMFFSISKRSGIECGFLFWTTWVVTWLLSLWSVCCHSVCLTRFCFRLNVFLQDPLCNYKKSVWIINRNLGLIFHVFLYSVLC